MARCAALQWMLVASVPAFRAVMADALPGGACQVSSCCEEWGESFGHFQKAALSGSGSFTVVNERPRSTACPLLALTANITEGTGVCGTGSPDNMNISAALEDHLHHDVSSTSATQVVIEPGLCSQLSESCWQSPDGPTTYVQMDQKVYQNGITGCTVEWARTDPAVGWATACAIEEPFGLRIRAEWVNGTSDDQSWCHSGEEDKFELITESMWTQASIAGLPSWYCMDVPETPMGEAAYRMLVYSVGHPPCQPPSQSTTPTNSGSAGLKTAANSAIMLSFFLVLATLTESFLSGMQ